MKHCVPIEYRLAHLPNVHQDASVAFSRRQCRSLYRWEIEHKDWWLKLYTFSKAAVGLKKSLLCMLVRYNFIFVHLHFGCLLGYM